jgi:hypothetical protein
VLLEQLVRLVLLALQALLDMTVQLAQLVLPGYKELLAQPVQLDMTVQLVLLVQLDQQVLLVLQDMKDQLVLLDKPALTATNILLRQIHHLHWAIQVIKL